MGSSTNTGDDSCVVLWFHSPGNPTQTSKTDQTNDRIWNQVLLTSIDVLYMVLQSKSYTHCETLWEMRYSVPFLFQTVPAALIIKVNVTTCHHVDSSNPGSPCCDVMLVQCSSVDNWHITHTVLHTLNHPQWSLLYDTEYTADVSARLFTAALRMCICLLLVTQTRGLIIKEGPDMFPCRFHCHFSSARGWNKVYGRGSFT